MGDKLPKDHRCPRPGAYANHRYERVNPHVYRCPIAIATGAFQRRQEVKSPFGQYLEVNIMSFV
jgi:hypothetical protein